MTGTHLVHQVPRVAAATTLLLLIPLISMQFTNEVSWGPGDFVAAAALLFTSGMAYSLLARSVRTAKHRVIVGAVVLTVLATVWAELAVGLFR